MWNFLANKILRNRLLFFISLMFLTAIMGYQASKIQLSYEFAKVLPSGDPALIEYEQFKKIFGEDGSVMVIGLEDKNFFVPNKFNDWSKLTNDISKIDGINNVLSVGNMFSLVKSDSLNKFILKPIHSQPVLSANEMDSISKQINSLPFFDGLLYNKETGATLMAITFSKKDLNTIHRIEIVNKIKVISSAFAEKHQLKLHYSGMPYIRTAIMQKVSHEMILFLILAVVVMSLILWLFFRSFINVLFSILIVAIGVIWSVGTIELLHLKITMLSGLIPPLIMVIGIPNCVFLINKYHTEYAKHQNKMKSLVRMIETIGVTLFLANITTSIGFAVLYFTNSTLLVEFGIIAAINVMTTFIITLILVPIILSILPPPALKHTQHLQAKRMTRVLEAIDYIVHHKRKTIYVIITIVTLISLYGMSKVNVIGFVVDDLPEKDPVYTDIKFFENNFHGILPFEILIDTKKENGVFASNAKTLYKINKLQKELAAYPEFSKPISIVEGIKFYNQAYHNGDSKYYILPGIADLSALNSSNSGNQGNVKMFQSFIDSSKRYTRVSVQMADIGSKEIKNLTGKLRPAIDSIFDPKEYTVKLTGHSLIFLQGNDYLLVNLFESLLIEILLITLVGVALFRSLRIILLSKIPCLIPLIITAGLMGYLGIRFKPSTILIFSIAFGISSDGTIYFLTRFRHEIKKYNRSVADAISITIKETGIGMIYTAVILFSGFAIFAASDFGGTAAMGILISITLLCAMVTNLILLPALLLSIDKNISKKAMLTSSAIEIPDED